MKQKRIDYNGFGFKLLSKFLLILAIIIFLIWILEVLFFGQIYQDIRSSTVNEVCSVVSQNFDEQNSDQYFKLSMDNDCSIIVFTVENDTATILFNSSRVNNETAMTISKILSKLDTTNQVSYLDNAFGIKTVNVAKQATINDKTVYFYVSSILTPIESTVQVMTFLLLIISIVSLIITFILSWFSAKNLSQPIVNLSKQAELLSSGNLDVKFDSREYSEVAKLSDTLNYSIQEIKRSQTIQKEVIQNVSHELRTPLTIIQSYAELIEDYSGDNPEKRKAHIEVILDESKKLEYLINDIIDLSKMQAKTMEYNFEKFNLSDSLDKFVEFYRNKYADFEFIATYDQDLFVTADKKRIEQVITNLINNAINYSSDTKKVIITVDKQQNNIYHLAIQDFGIGIKSEDQALIFDRHFRATNAKRAVAGSGVGLTIVKEILNFHGYNYGLTSELGKGSTFFVDIKGD